MNKKYFLLCLFFLLIFAGCSKDKDNVKQPEKVNSAASVVSDTEAAITDSDIDYTEYSETNEKFDSDNRVILSNIYDPYNNFVGYRKYSYLENGEISEMQTFNADDKLKSTIHYDYVTDNDTQSVIITLKDSEDSPVIKNSFEYTKDSDGNTQIKNEVFELADGKLIYRTEHYYDSGEEEITYFGADGNMLSDDEKTKATDEAEKIMYLYIF